MSSASHFLVCHVGDTVDKAAIDAPLDPIMKVKLPALLRHLIEEHGPPKQFFVSPYRAGRESWALCLEILDSLGVHYRVDPQLAKRLPVHYDPSVHLASGTRKISPPAGESIDAFNDRVVQSFFRYKKLAATGNGPVWIMTHSDVMLKMAELDGRTPDNDLDYRSYFRVGEEAAISHHKTQRQAGNVAIRLRDQEDVAGPPLATPVPAPPPHLPDPAAAASSSSSASAAKEDEEEGELCSCGRTRLPPPEGLDLFRINPGKFNKDGSRRKVKRRYRIVVTGNPYATRGAKRGTEEFDASVRLPDSELSFFGEEGDDTDESEGSGFVLAASASTTTRINPAKLQGLTYVKKPITGLGVW